MRPRSLSVAVDRHDIISKKFEGVASDENEEVVSDSDDPDDDQQAPEGKSDWTNTDYDDLFQKIRAVLPNSDNRKAASRIKTIDWTKVAFGDHSADEVKDVTYKLIAKVRKYRTLGEMLDDITKKSIVGVPKKPKAPPSAYNFYVKANLRIIKQENPELTANDVFRKVAEQFKQLSDKKKQKYEQLAEQAKEQYKKELEKFYIDNPNATPKKNTGKLPKNKVPKKPSKVTPYNLFVYQQKLEGLNVSNADMKKQWESIDFEQKVKFIREAYSSEQSKLTKSEKDLLDIAHGKPEIVPRSTCEYYLKKHAVRNTSITPQAWRKSAMAEFRALPKIRKLELELELRRAQGEFVRKYRAYIDKLPAHEKQPEIDLLQLYLQTTMEKEEKLKYDGGDLTGCSGTNELGDLPLAESTTNEIEPRKKKSSKKVTSAELPPPSPVASKPLKSILKSPAPKHKLDEPDASTTASKKKKKSETPVVDSESDSSYKQGKKKPKKEKESSNGVDSDRGTGENGSNLNRFAVKEPKRPPKDIMKYYKKFHYFGKAGKHKESFEKLSAQRKKMIEEEMRAAQKKYMVDLKKFLDHLPKSEVKAYVTHLKEFVKNGSSADEGETEEEEAESVPKKKSPAKKNTTKQEPPSDSSEDDSDEY